MSDEVTSTPVSEKIIGYADIYSDPSSKPKVKVEPRQVDAAPQATFNYGDGTYLIKFSYKQDAKAAERAGAPKSSTNPQDKTDKNKNSGEKLPDQNKDNYE